MSEIDDYTKDSGLNEDGTSESSQLNEYESTDTLSFEDENEGVPAESIAFGGLQVGKKKYDQDDVQGIWIGKDSDGKAKINVGDTTSFFKWDGTRLDILSVYYNFIPYFFDPTDLSTTIWSVSGTTFVSAYNYFSFTGLADGRDGALYIPLDSFNTQGFGKGLIIDADVKFASSGTPSNNGTQGVGFGITDNAGDDSFALDTPNAVDGVGFYIDNSDGKLYGRCFNGGTKTDTEITGITVTNINRYRIIFETGVQARFIINNSLVATITTNLPSSTSAIYLGYACKNNGDTYYIHSAAAPVINIEK